MAKNDDEVIKDFNELVNMTVDELEAFLKTDDSKSTGWTADGGDGESVGHESGRKIVDILKRNPSKDASKYTDADKQHMHKVVAYCKRHLAQEGHMKNEKSEEELKKTKSYRSLKNWGHDPLKGKGKGGGGKPASKKAEKPGSKKVEKPVSKKAEEAESKKADKPVSKKAEKPVSKKADKVEEKEEEKADKPKSKGAARKTEAAETGEKREADGAAEKGEKPASKKAKTTKPPSEGSRKPPSRGAKKA